MKNDPARRAIRTLLQLIASGGLTVLVGEFVDGLTPRQAALTLAAWQVVVTYLQNVLEDKGTIPSLLKAPASDGANPVPEI